MQSKPLAVQLQSPPLTHTQLHGVWMSHYLSSYGTFALVSDVEGSVLLKAMQATAAVTVAVVVVLSAVESRVQGSLLWSCCGASCARAVVVAPLRVVQV